MATKRPTIVTPGTDAPSAGGSALASGKRTIRQRDKTTQSGAPADGGPADATTGGAPPESNPPGPAARLVDTQVRTLADLCEALDRKCLELLEEVAAARAAEAASQPAIAALNQTLAEERALRAKLERELAEKSRAQERELAEARREKAALEREIAAMRLVLERSSRPSAVSRAKTAPIEAAPDASVARANGEHAARLLPLLQASFASGQMTAVHDTNRALARFRAAAMIDAIEGTRAAPICLGWLLSRSDLLAEPLMFLMDDVGLLGWTDANLDRLDVSTAYRNTKPRSGFKAALSRMPVGRLRGVVALHEPDSEAAVFFEAARKVIPKNLLS